MQLLIKVDMEVEILQLLISPSNALRRHSTVRSHHVLQFLQILPTNKQPVFYHQNLEAPWEGSIH